MGILNTITDSLHLLGKAIDPQAITQVHISFDHSPSDLPDPLTWKVRATLTGSKGFSEEGVVAVAFKQEWEGEGGTDEEALLRAHGMIVEYLKSFLNMRQDEAMFAEQAVMTACSQLPDLSTMWTVADPQDQGSVGE